MNDAHLEHLSGVFLDPNPGFFTLDTYIVLDRILFRLLQFLKDKGQCNGNEVRLVFIDDLNNSYYYNQFSAATLTPAQLLDLNVLTPVVQAHILSY